MSIVVGHTIAGYAAAEAAGGRRLFDRWWKTALFAAVLANLPDLDFLPGLLVGDADRFHHGAAHSLVAALAVGALAGVVLRGPGRRGRHVAAAAAAVYASHGLVDTVSPERAGPHAGVELLWPFSSARLSAEVPLPEGLYGALTPGGAGSSEGFLATIVGWDTLLAMGTEALLFAPLLAVAWAARKAWDRREGGGASG